jgi:hypothetical protein
MLSNSVFSNNAQTYADLKVQEISQGNGYSPGRTVSISLVSNTTQGSANCTVLASNLVFNATSNWPVFQFAAIYGGAGNCAVCWWDGGAEFSMGSGDQCTIEFAEPLIVI